MIRKESGFLAVVLIKLFPLHPSPVSISSTGDKQEDWERENGTVASTHRLFQNSSTGHLKRLQISALL